MASSWHKTGYKREYSPLTNQTLEHVIINNISVVGGIPTPLKNMSSSVGMFIPNTFKVIKFMFQTTNQITTVHIKEKKTEFHGSCSQDF